jgi:hypothetical protein
LIAVVLAAGTLYICWAILREREDLEREQGS